MAAKVLFWDIETAPIIAYVWGMHEQNVGLEQIHTDWHVLAWAAKWKDSKEVMYMDQRRSKEITDDKKILEGLWKLLDEADVVVTQNGKKFDAKKVNARFIEHGLKPPSPYKHVDTLQLAKRQFGFTSNKLAYMTDKLCERYKKLDHGKFPGFSLWKECLKGNKKAWNEMREYNKHDVLALEELYGKLAPWGAGYDPNVYTETFERVCLCGASSWRKSGYKHTTLSKHQAYKCKVCGAWTHDRSNLFSKEKVASLKVLHNGRQAVRQRARDKNAALLKPRQNRTCPNCGSENCQVGGTLTLSAGGWKKSMRCMSCLSHFKVLSIPLRKEEVRAIHSRKLKTTDCPKCGAEDSCRKKANTKLSGGVVISNTRCNECGRFTGIPLQEGHDVSKSKRRSK